MMRSQFLTSVVANHPLCREHFRLVLRIDRGFPPTEPGQFVQVLCRDIDERGGETTGGAFLRRPFSLAGRRDQADGSTEIDIIHRVVGIGTEWMSRLREGDRVSILGPLGNRFQLPHPDEVAILVGGGVGIPPMLYLAEKLSREKRRAIAFVGATSCDLLPLTTDAKTQADGEPAFCVQEFSGLGIPAVISTDDGSLGTRGFITKALEQFLNRKSQIASRKSLFTCGPEPMMKRVAQIGADHGIPVQVAVERAMACGMGTCQSCCIKVRRSDSDWRYALTCTEGPIFAATDLLW